jgi:hypothetical protein
MNPNKTLKKSLTILIVTCIVALVFVTIVTAENTANNWTLHDPQAGVDINIRTTGAGNNLVFYATLTVNEETTISITVPGTTLAAATLRPT